MAPYGACEVAQSTARSNAQFEAERFRKGCRRKNKQNRKCFRRKQKYARKCFRRKEEACSSSDLERSVTSEHARAMISSAQWPRTKKKHARALILSAQSLSDAPKSKLEHWFRAPSVQKASSSSDFERPVATEHVRAVISSAQSKKLRLCSVFEGAGRTSRACAVFSKAQPSKVGSLKLSTLPGAKLSKEFNI